MSLRHAVLGFLSLAPMSGYDLRKHMHESTAHFWPADQAQIYRTLSQLTTDGLVDVRVIPQDGRPDRREHHITQAGLDELDAWLTAPTEWTASREPFLVRMFFLGRLGPERARAALLDRAEEAREMIAVLDQTRQGVEEAIRQGAIEPDLSIRLRIATLTNGLAHARAELDWTDEVLQTL